MTLTGTRAPLVVLLTVSAATMLVAKDRIFVDQWSPTRSELTEAASMCAERSS